MVVRIISEAAEVAIFIAAASLLVIGVLKVCWRSGRRGRDC